MPRCRHCKKEAIVFKHWFWMCKEHFLTYYLNRVKRVLDKFDLKDKRLLVAVSWGKDSQALLDIMAELKPHYGYHLEWLFIKLWVGDACSIQSGFGVVDEEIGKGFNKFCRSAYESIMEVANEHNIKINIVDLEREYGHSVPELAAKWWKACSVCGTSKRYVMNRFARENNFDIILTWHNLTDLVIFANLNIVASKYDEVLNVASYWLPWNKDLKLVGKLKPQFRLEEEDNELYCSLKWINYVSSSISCPLNDKKSTHNIFETYVKDLEKKYNYSYHFMKFLRKTLNFDNLANKWEAKFCKKCWYLTNASDGICRFCKIMDFKNEKISPKTRLW